ncbi:MAG: hypothetical protein H7330_05020 [Hymenobacteraceae bacterium]|nr:hypothetical protein [Hymenobacteraceae bacterium]
MNKILFSGFFGRRPVLVRRRSLQSPLDRWLLGLHAGGGPGRVAWAWLCAQVAARYRSLVVAGSLTLLAGPGLAQASFAPLAAQPPDNILGLVADPTVAGTLYACNVLKVITSANDGATWSATGNTGAFNVKCVYVAASGQLYAGADKATLPGTTAGVFKYNKALNTWAPMLGSPLNVTALAVDPVTGNLYAGTGTTNNSAPNPTNYGLGVFVFNGATWSAANTGISALPGYSVLPAIKAFGRLPTGELVAATYGGGVLKYAGGIWSLYGAGLPNLNVNCLTLDGAGVLYAGTDNGAYAKVGAAWAVVRPGLPAGKPVRALASQGTTLYAGLGFYHYQKGSAYGEIFSTNPAVGPSWTNAGAGFNSMSVLALVATPTTVQAAACGVWKLTAGTWAFSQSGITLANRVFRLVQNSQGHLFAMCSNPLGSGGVGGSSVAFGGVFRSTDGGASWTSINQGVNYQRLTAIFVDSQDHLWLAGHQFKGLSVNPAYVLPELYKSTDNGTTWVVNTSINVSQDEYEFMAEATNGRMYVTHAFGSPTNLSATNDYGTFANNLMPTATTARTYGFALNAANDVFVGTEIDGIWRSTANGAAGSFVGISTNAPTAPQGNNLVYVDPYTGTVFASGTHGRVNGVGNHPKRNFASLPADNGLNLFPFNNLPDYGGFGAVSSDNRGNVYFHFAGFTFAQTGLYVGQAPFSSSTVFTRLTISPMSTVSYQFSSFIMDKQCGYLYATNITGAGIYRSTQPLNTPSPTALVTPLAAATNVPTMPTFGWVSTCASESCQLQIAPDAAFSTLSYDNAAVAGNSLSLPNGILTAGGVYFWRVRSTNAAGIGPWSAARGFSTEAPLPITLVHFRAALARHAPRVDLMWQTAGTVDGPYFTLERSADGLHFERLRDVPAQLSAISSLTSYATTDDQPTPGINYYRLRWAERNAAVYSAIVLATTGQGAECLPVVVRTIEQQLAVRASCEHPAFRVNLYNLLGAAVGGVDWPANQPEIALPTVALPRGIYVLRVSDNVGQPVKKEKLLID